MKWGEVRRLYPNQYVQVKIIKSNVDGNVEKVEEVAIIRSISDPKEATAELMKSRGDTLVYHTRNEKMELEIRNHPGFRGII
ncbi:hypothetical protein DCCM_4466 [Desulfocucumis palustris]|uniref:Uncharacterized protein n=1 Tax=Desulfocucumis palustris TaxID=1898651 RepID=A0A2L2XI31_9FIRM|nr:hypothetical protein [Desulfocucumis palustris]GBF35343.1 hypothetical protein DCCM_4466 [Desulfocucumis palustris]